MKGSGPEKTCIWGIWGYAIPGSGQECGLDASRIARNRTPRAGEGGRGPAATKAVMESRSGRKGKTPNLRKPNRSNQGAPMRRCTLPAYAPREIPHVVHRASLSYGGCPQPTETIDGHLGRCGGTEAPYYPSIDWSAAYLYTSRPSRDRRHKPAHVYGIDRSSREADVPAEQAEAEEDPRVPQTHEHQSGTRCVEAAAREGPETPVRVDRSW